MTSHDSLLVRGVRVPTSREPDGGAPVDVLVADGRVAAIEPVGALDPPAPGRQIEGHGRLLLPGFVDAHVHGAAAVFDPDVQRAMLRQGITTIVVGQDGLGLAPTGAPGEPGHAAFAYADEYFRAIDGEHPTFRGGSVAALRATWAGLPVTVETLAPHGTIRHAVLGTADRPATADETARMAALLGTALDDGAVGLSTGLEYVPAAFATEDELVALARVCAARGVPHVSHMRGYEEKAPGAFAELVRVARASGVATHVSHFHGPADVLVALVDGAHAEGLDVTFDTYPYLRGSSILSMVALPTWLPAAEPDRAVALLRDAAVRERLRTEHFPALADLWPRVTMANVPGGLRWAEGLRLVDVAARLGLEPQDAAVELLVSTRLQAGCVFEQPPTSSAASVRALANHGAHLAGSDAIYAGGRPHPRGWGAFARFVAEHVGTGDWTWADAVEHLSARAARRFGLAGRGAVAAGARADLVLVDPTRARDLATYEAPRVLAEGVDDVLVRGRHVLRDGELAPDPDGGRAPRRAQQDRAKEHR